MLLLALPTPEMSEEWSAAFRLFRNWFWLNFVLLTECRRWYTLPTEGDPTAFLSSRTPVGLERGTLVPVQGTDMGWGRLRLLL